MTSSSASLPRALRANTHAHFRRYSEISGRLTLRVLHVQVAQFNQRLATSGERLKRAETSLLRQRRERLTLITTRFAASRAANLQAQQNAIIRERDHLGQLGQRAHRAMTALIERRDAMVQYQSKMLAALSYRSVLARGFALVRNADDNPVHAAAEISAGAQFSVEFADGRVQAIATSDAPTPTPSEAVVKKPARAKAASAPKRASKPVDQGSLF